MQKICQLVRSTKIYGNRDSFACIKISFYVVNYPSASYFRCRKVTKIEVVSSSDFRPRSTLSYQRRLELLSFFNDLSYAKQSQFVMQAAKSFGAILVWRTPIFLATSIVIRDENESVFCSLIDVGPRI